MKTVGPAITCLIITRGPTRNYFAIPSLNSFTDFPFPFYMNSLVRFHCLIPRLYNHLRFYPFLVGASSARFMDTNTYLLSLVYFSHFICVAIQGPLVLSDRVT